MQTKLYQAILGQLQIELTSPICVAGVGRSVLTLL